MSDHPFISVCIIGRNEEDKLGPCLEAVTWADEIVYVDLESTDGSVALARHHGARVVAREPVPIVELVRNEAAGHARGNWILALDPDERPASGLEHALRAISHRNDVDAVEIPFMHFDLGWPAGHPLLRFDPKPRFYRKDAVRWPLVPNRLPEVDPTRVLRLPDDESLVIRHMRNRNLAEILDRVLRYAPAEAQAMLDAGEVFSARAMGVTLSGKAYRQFVAARAFDDGVPGLFRASTLVLFHLYVWMELWQRSGAQRTPEDDRYVRRVGRVASGLLVTTKARRAPRALVERLRRLTSR